MADDFFLGEKIGALTEAVQAQRRATEENTAALAEGRKEFEAIRSDIHDIKTTAPCLNGKPLPANCPALPQTEAAPDVAADAAKWRWIVAGWSFFRAHWQKISIAGILAGLFGDKACAVLSTITKAIFGGTLPPTQ